MQILVNTAPGFINVARYILWFCHFCFLTRLTPKFIDQITWSKKGNNHKHIFYKACKNCAAVVETLKLCVDKMRMWMFKQF